MNQRLPGAIILLGATAAVAQPAARTDAPASTAPAAAAPAAVPSKPAPKVAAPVQTVTPNAQRIVSIGALNKRTGLTRVFTGRPGQ